MNSIKSIAAPGMFRIILAATVLISHTLPLKIGTAAVYLFFVLSGYWIYNMWHREYAPLKNSVAVFYKSRVLRIFPPTILVLALLFICAKIFHLWTLDLPKIDSLTSLHFYFSHIFLLGYSSLPGSLRIVVPLWSLDNELQFYIISPIIIWAISKKNNLSIEKWILLAISLIGLYFVLFRFGFDSTVGWIPNYLIFFLIGMFSARNEWRPSRPLVYGGIILSTLLILICIIITPLRGIFLSGRFSSEISFMNPIGNIIIGFLLAPYAIATTKKPSTPKDKFLGNISFEIYLVHEAVLIALTRFTGYSAGEPLHDSFILRYTVIFLEYVIITIISLLIYFYVDRPINNIRRRWMKKQLMS